MPIQLNASQVIVVTQGGTPVDTQDTVAVTQMHGDMLGGESAFTFSRGTPASNGFAPSSARSSTLPRFTINATTGQWSSDTQSGTLTAQQLTAFNNNQRALKNGVEALVVGLGLIPGTIVQWT